MNMLTQKQGQRISRRRCERGFSVIEMVIVVAIVAVISTFALIGVEAARAGQRRVNSARMLSSYLEKARVDSVRRRAENTVANPLATVTIVDANSYSVFLDFNGNGTPIARTFTLEPGVAFMAEDIAAVISFDWRGRTGNDRRLEVFNADHPNDNKYMTRIAVSSFGDVTVNRDVATPSINVNTTEFASPTPTP